MSNRRHPNVINIEEADSRDLAKGKHFAKLRRVGAPAGSKELGAVHTVVPPGKISFPFHLHHAMEEAIYVLSGKGIARIGDARVEVKPGDWIALPAGPNHAHQMINDGDTDLVYLCVSTVVMPEVVEYPDSKKSGVTVADPSSPMGFKRLGLFRSEDSVDDYWDREPDAKE